MAGDGLRGIRTGTPVPSAERESAPAQNDVHTDNWGPDGVAKYIEERFGEKLRRRQSGRRPLNLNPKREDEGEMAMFGLTREKYLDERRAGKERHQIARENEITVTGLKYHLRKWDLLDPAIEQVEMDKSSDSEVAVAAEPNAVHELPSETPVVGGMEPTPEPIDVEMHYEKSVTPKNDTTDELHYITIRVPLAFEGWPAELKDSPIKMVDRDHIVQVGTQMLQNAVAWAWKELTDILGPGDYTTQVEQYIERKLVALAE